MEIPLEFDINGIKQCQRNRYPLLFVDRVFDVIPGEKASGLKCFTYNEWFFPPHFDDEPNVPGFIQVEVLVQVFIMCFLSQDQLRGKKTNFISMENVRFKRKIVPGETMKVNAVLKSFRRGIAFGSAISFVGDSQACSGDFTVAVPDVLNQFKPQKNS
jgi:3-hydroxyacyl-[acyl-carrier-protein] dehydratase